MKRTREHVALTRSLKRRVHGKIDTVPFNSFYVDRFLEKVRIRAKREEQVTVDDILMGRVPQVAHMRVGWRNPDDCVPRLGMWFESPEIFLREALFDRRHLTSACMHDFDDAMEIDLFDPRTQQDEIDAYLVPV